MYACVPPAQVVSLKARRRAWQAQFFRSYFEYLSTGLFVALGLAAVTAVVMIPVAGLMVAAAACSLVLAPTPLVAVIPAYRAVGPYPRNARTLQLQSLQAEYAEQLQAAVARSQPLR